MIIGIQPEIVVSHSLRLFFNEQMCSIVRYYWHLVQPAEKNFGLRNKEGCLLLPFDKPAVSLLLKFLNLVQCSKITS